MMVSRFMLDLREVTQLAHGGALVVAGEGEIARAAPEAVLEVAAATIRRTACALGLACGKPSPAGRVHRHGRATHRR